MNLAEVVDARAPQRAGVDPFSRLRDGEAVTVDTAPAIRASGDQVVTIRTFNGPLFPLADDREIKGASCTLRAPKFEATVTTPGGVRVPLFGRASPTLSVHCAKDGFDETITLMKPVRVGAPFALSLQLPSAMSPGGVVAALVGSALASQATTAPVTYRYRDMRVALAPSVGVTTQDDAKPAAKERARPARRSGLPSLIERDQRALR